MLAFALSLAIVALWAALGWSLLVLCGHRRRLLRTCLLAPSVGAALLLLVVFELNRFGQPVRLAGPVATLLTALLVPLAWRRARTPLPVRHLCGWSALLAAAALAVGYPLLIHGFDWLSFGNDDMANYVLSAHGFFDHGYLDRLDFRSVADNRDPSLLFWLDQILMGARCGSELTLAWVMSLTGRPGAAIFMPTIVALHVSLVAAAAAMVQGVRATRGSAQLTAVLVGASALTTLSTLYQLISQVWGVMLLCAAATLLLEPLRAGGLRPRALLPGVLVCSAFGIAYPEMLPFFGLAFLLAHAGHLLHRRERLVTVAATVAATAAMTVVLLHVYLGSTLAFLQNQATKGLRPVPTEDVLFPFYLVPSGLAVFWGFLPIASPDTSLLALKVAAGAVLLLAVSLLCLRDAWRGHVPAVVSVVMLALALRLVSTRTDFGVFKLSLYIQPFLLAAIVDGWSRLTARMQQRRAGMTLVWSVPLVVAALGLPAQLAYMRTSAELPGALGGFVELPGASRAHFVSTLSQLRVTPGRTVISDTSNVVLAKLQSVFLRPAAQRYPAKNYFAIAEAARWRQLVNWAIGLTQPSYVADAQELRRARYARFVPRSFDMRDGRSNAFEMEPIGAAVPDVLVAGPQFSVLNGLGVAGFPAMQLLPAPRLTNHLILVDSALGAHYYQAGPKRAAGLVALYQPEHDPYGLSGRMAAAGRTLLFRVLNPTPGARLAVEFSATLNGAGRTALGDMAVIGETRVPLDAVGYGSARLLSAPLAPQHIDDGTYLALDLGTVPGRFPDHRSGVAGWWGRDVPIDPRRLVGFVRDVSLVGTNDAGRAPTSVEHFPEALRDRRLLYSGIYEDGWIGDRVRLRLAQPAQTDTLVVRAQVPALPSAPVAARLSVDGITQPPVAVTPGAIELLAPVSGAPRVHDVRISFDRTVRLPSPDDRPASAQLESVRFAWRPEARPDIAALPLQLGEGWYPFERWEGDSFRWAAGTATLRLDTPAAIDGVLVVDVAPGSASVGPLRLSIKTSGVERHERIDTRRTLRVPVHLAAGTHVITFSAPPSHVQSSPDPRTLTYRVFRVTFSPTPKAASQP